MAELNQILNAPGADFEQLSRAAGERLALLRNSVGRDAYQPAVEQFANFVRQAPADQREARVRGFVNGTREFKQVAGEVFQVMATGPNALTLQESRTLALELANRPDAELWDIPTGVLMVLDRLPINNDRQYDEAVRKLRYVSIGQRLNTGTVEGTNSVYANDLEFLVTRGAPEMLNEAFLRLDAFDERERASVLTFVATKLAGIVNRGDLSAVRVGAALQRLHDIPADTPNAAPPGKALAGRLGAALWSPAIARTLNKKYSDSLAVAMTYNQTTTQRQSPSSPKHPLLDTIAIVPGGREALTTMKDALWFESWAELINVDGNYESAIRDHIDEVLKRHR